MTSNRIKRLEKIEGDFENRRCRLGDGQEITIDVSNDSRIVVKDSDENQIGEIGLRIVEMPFGSEDYYHIDRLDISWTGQGIGRECLVHFKEYYGTRITAADEDGTRMDDGSHLTGDGPGFISKMREEGIVS